MSLLPEKGNTNHNNNNRPGREREKRPNVYDVAMLVVRLLRHTNDAIIAYKPVPQLKPELLPHINNTSGSESNLRLSYDSSDSDDSEPASNVELFFSVRTGIERPTETETRPRAPSPSNTLGALQNRAPAWAS
ncbi:hypothetical protein ColTof3_14746 [Colletotrichum tofieldiae]|nr:hypothetical protein ColTof3_14746 [Colletotrichum tofieldiae]